VVPQLLGSIAGALTRARERIGKRRPIDWFRDCFQSGKRCGGLFVCWNRSLQQTNDLIYRHCRSIGIASSPTKPQQETAMPGNAIAHFAEAGEVNKKPLLEERRDADVKSYRWMTKEYRGYAPERLACTEVRRTSNSGLSFQTRSTSHPDRRSPEGCSIGGVPKSKPPGKAPRRSKAPKGLVHGVPCRPPIHQCASDNADINATDDNSNGCLNPSFLDIKWHPRLSFQCVASATPRGNTVGKQGLR